MGSMCWSFKKNRVEKTQIRVRFCFQDAKHLACLLLEKPRRLLNVNTEYSTLPTYLNSPIRLTALRSKLSCEAHDTLYAMWYSARRIVGCLGSLHFSLHTRRFRSF